MFGISYAQNKKTFSRLNVLNNEKLESLKQKCPMLQTEVWNCLRDKWNGINRVVMKNRQDGKISGVDVTHGRNIDVKKIQLL